MRMAKVLSAALLTGLLAVAGCSGGDDKATSDPNAKVTLSYGVWDANQKPVMESLAAEFTKTHPNITVQVQLTPWADYWTKLKAAATGGAAPDVFWMNGPNFQLYASNKVIAPMPGDADLSVYPKPLADLYTFEGKPYGLPKDMDTVAVWYNKTLFDAKKVPYPKDDWTWADFQDAAAKLSDPAKGIYGTAAQLGSFQEYQYDTIAQAGGYVISPDGKKSGYADPKTIAGLKFWTDLIEKKQLARSEDDDRHHADPALRGRQDRDVLGRLVERLGVHREQLHQGQGRRRPAAQGREAGHHHPRRRERRLDQDRACRPGLGVRPLPRLEGRRRAARPEGPDPGVQRDADARGSRRIPSSSCRPSSTP